jgi:glutamate racemase
MAATGKIGVFDSGFGGLHTLRNLVDALPQYDYVYLGDSARAPYGPRAPEEVYAFSCQAVDFLFAHGCELIIFACNTASSVALRKIQQEYLPVKYADKKVLGVTIPLAEVAAVTTKNKRVGIIATQGTVDSEVFVRELNKLNPSIQIFQQSAPRLVTMIEAGEQESDELRDAVSECLKPLFEDSIDTLILGCTHYGLIIDTICEVAVPEVTVVSEATAEPRALAVYLTRHPDIDAQLSRGATVEFYSTNGTEKFDALGSIFFKHPVKSQKVSL